MSLDLWLGSVTALAGTALGGVISFALSRQQINEARRQRREESQRLREQSSADRRFNCYSDFISKARSYRNAIRLLALDEMGQADMDRLDGLAAAADAASSLVFLVVESPGMYDACHAVLRSIGTCQAYIHQPAVRDSSYTAHIKERLAASLREFQAASRHELDVTGVESSRIMGDYSSGEQAEQEAT